ncbi:PKD domain-containing protein [bacterium]|nr:PKD domain-containing protein [bacterium]
MNMQLTVPVVIAAFIGALSPLTLPGDTNETSLGVIPLTDMRNTTYRGFAGGLYPGYRNTPPPVHLALGLAAATNFVPLDANGQPSPTGRIVLVSIGMSNTTMEYSRFRQMALVFPARNPQCIVVDGAQGGQTADKWIDVNAPTYTNVDVRLAQSGVNSNQVQALWIKQAIAGPNNRGSFPYHAQFLKDLMVQLVKAAKLRYPNLKIAYLSSRTRAYTTVQNSLNPELFAFESAFSMRWLIEDQINGTNGLNCDAAMGPVTAPWLAWGPYVWADGTNTRSDGFTWPPEAVNADFTHPSALGQSLVATQLLAFFSTDATAIPWFLRKAATGLPPVCSASANVTSGAVPLTVSFTANASDSDGSVYGYLWTFNDGTFSTQQNPVKKFNIAGTYDARLTVTDNAGNPTTLVIRITAEAPPGEHPTPYLAANSYLSLMPRNASIIGPSLLRVAAASIAPSNITYNVTTTAAFGTVLLNGTGLLLNGTFSQQDIDQSRLSYTNKANRPDEFLFSVSDGAGGGFTNARFVVMIVPEPAVLACALAVALGFGQRRNEQRPR